ncbi:hypothetical protein LTR09_000635 [Extremus antarcticus]|uniref:Uncharacterized protein n=1 Tax=Extremus antarcticus TaxID=702011 RepID=A0AAJ0LXP3_9PEZI|nr:hypothetical protein LTR09_000635 [Extremus antarcticus]
MASWTWFIILGFLLSDLHSAFSTSIVNPEPAFGIEFTLDHVLASVSLPGSSLFGPARTYALAEIHCGEAYQSLMRRNLDFCQDISVTQTPPLQQLRDTWLRAQQQEDARRAHEIRRRGPRQSWISSSWDSFLANVLRRSPELPPVFHKDEFVGDAEVDVLEQTIARLREAMMVEMKRNDHLAFYRHWDISFPWAYTRIVVPDFFFTTIAPKTEEEIQPENTVSWGGELDEESLWYPFIARKLAVALYRNHFRQRGSSKYRFILGEPINATTITPSSWETLSRTRRHHCVHPEGQHALNRVCGPATLSPASIVVNLNNATLSLWLDGSHPMRTPWSTFPTLGGHELGMPTSRCIISNDDWESFDRERIWDKIFSEIDSISERIDPVDSGAVDLILYGELGSKGPFDGFERRLQSNAWRRKIEIVNVLSQPDEFTASKRAARLGRYDLDARWASYKHPGNVVGGSRDEL